MRIYVLFFFLIILSLSAFGQPPAKKTPKTVKTPPAKTGTEAQEFEKAKSIADAEKRAAALQNFVKTFPESSEIPRAQGLIVGARAELADKKLQAGDTAGGIELFKLALQDAPTPVPEELYAKVILGFPISLYSRNQRAAAFDITKLIEEKVGANASQILDLAKFFINIQYGTEAIRLAKKSTELAPGSANGFLTLAIANRLNFQLEDAAAAYAKAVELDGASSPNRLGLAEMKRALGKYDEAAAIYRSMLEKDAANTTAQTGLTLVLFEAGKIREAEAEMTKTLEANPNNAPLLTGAAYWYAANGDSAKAVELAQKSIALDQSNVWSYIAEARGLLAQKKPLEAEKVLLAARQYGDFPTLDYELASVRLAAGLYREAAETLKRNFTVNKEGAVETYLGNRILADADSFGELLSLERRVSLFQGKAADTPENNEKLKSLLQFQQKLEAADTSESDLAAAAENFAKGTDNMRLHRQIFAASRLLQKKTAATKTLELMQSAIGGVDGALNVVNPSAAVLADEIYDSRQYALSQNLVVVVPDIPRPTLSAILRGRIEDIAAQAYFQQKDTTQAVVHLKRALSVLPEKSAFSRASYQHLGEVLQADGKDKEAVEAYLKSYNKEIPDETKRAFIENLYLKVYGNTDGLEEKIGVKTETTVAMTETKPTPNIPEKMKLTDPTPTPEMKPESTPTPKALETPSPTPEIKPNPIVENQNLPENLPNVAPVKSPAPTPTETPIEAKPSPTPAPTPENTSTPEIKSEETKNKEVESTETKTRPSPASQSLSVVVTDNTLQIPPSPKVNPTKTPVKVNESKTTDSMFDPVIINVGKTETPKMEEKKPENSQKPEIKPDEKTSNGEIRPRIIITENTGAKTVTEEISSCKITVNQENLSLLNGGGSLGVEVGFEGTGDLSEIKGVSSSPQDIEVTLDPEIGKDTKKLFFIVKSISTKTGVFTVIFEAPCGKKEILVKVR